MSLNNTDQFFSTIEKAQRILVILPEHADTDSIASGLALFEVLKKMQKECDIVSPQFTVSPNLNFLPHIHSISARLPQLKKFVIQLGLDNAKIDEFSYDIDAKNLNIYITPKEGAFKESDVKTSSGSYNYDVIITINVPDLESLGELFEKNSDFFYKRPIINIDHQADNEHFGQVNIIDLTVSSSAELLVQLCKTGKKDITEDMATTFLTGIIVATNSFKKMNVTPQTLKTVSELLALGGRREEIIQNVYKKNTLAALKLWGRALQRLEYDREHLIAWTTLSNTDFLETKAKPDNTAYIMQELINNAPNTNVILFLYETVFNTVEIVLYSSKSINGLVLLAPYHPKGTKNMSRCSIKNVSLENARTEILATIKEKISPNQQQKQRVN